MDESCAVALLRVGRAAVVVPGPPVGVKRSQETTHELTPALRGGRALRENCEASALARLDLQEGAPLMTTPDGAANWVIKRVARDERRQRSSHAAAPLGLEGPPERGEPCKLSREDALPRERTQRRRVTLHELSMQAQS